MILRKQQLIITTNVRIGIVDAKTERLLDEMNVNNLVTLSGRNLTRDLLINTPGANPLSHIATGTGTATALPSDTALGSEVYRASITKQSSADSLFNVFLYIGSTAANGSSLTEAGIFNASSGGDLFARVTHDAISKTSSIAVTYDWQVNLSSV